MITLATMTTKSTRTCPACGLDQERETTDCTRCGWDFSPLIGTSYQVEAFLRERLDRARTDWRQRIYNPEFIPKLERDPFETPAEFAARVAERPWYVGDCELLKPGYDIETGRFPLGIRSPQPWATRWVDTSNSYSLCLPRDQARGLYQRGAIWPVYARLAVNGSQVSLTALVMVAPDGELPVEIKATESHPNRTTNEAAVAATGSLISGRYRNLDDGTLLDTCTGLQWMRCPLGQSWDGRTCCGEAVSCKWNDLSERVAAFNHQGGYAGHRDWRVPTINELRTLIDEGTRNPATDRGAFPETRGWFWSSTLGPYGSSSAWFVNFNHGNVFTNFQSNAFYVRLVRDGQ